LRLPEPLASSLRGLSQLWQGMSRWQRLSLLGMFLLVLSTLVLVAFYATRPDFVPLFSNLRLEDQAAIVSKLKEMGVPYRVDSQFNAVLVPSSQVHEVRISLAAEGLPKGGHVGFELFDATRMGMTDFQEQVAYLRALEGELSRTIEAMEIVDRAKVNLVVPKQRLFREDQESPSASVLLKLVPGGKIKPEQVRAIMNLVARSVEGLRPEDVVVVDTLGNLLSEMATDQFLLRGEEQVTTVQKELEQRYELELERKIRAMLERIYGPGRSVVKARVELDFGKLRVRREEFIPGPRGTGVPRSQQVVEETFKGTGVPPGGVPGTETNIPGYGLVTRGEGQSEYAKTEEITNYEISREEREFQNSPGEVKRISVSVIVDGQLSQEELNGLREAVAAAAGFNPNRGDQVVVQSFRFSTEWAAQMEEALAAEARRKLIAAAVGLLAFVLLAGGYLAYRMYAARRRKLEEVKAPQPTLEDLLAHPELMAEKGELYVLEQQIKAYASNHPEEIAKLVKNWMTEE